MVKITSWILDSQLLPGLHRALRGEQILSLVQPVQIPCILNQGKQHIATGMMFGIHRDTGLSLTRNCNTVGGKFQIIHQHTDSLKQW